MKNLGMVIPASASPEEFVRKAFVNDLFLEVEKFFLSVSRLSSFFHHFFHQSLAIGVPFVLSGRVRPWGQGGWGKAAGVREGAPSGGEGGGAVAGS